MSKPTMFFGCSLAIFLMLFPANTISQAYSFTSVDVPGAQETVCNGINDAGNVVGFYVDDDGHYHGFLLKNGSFTFINYPAGMDTWVYGINDLDQMVGWWYSGASNTQGFEVSGGHYIRTIEDPNGSETYPWSITNAGEIVGTYAAASGSGVLYGFTDAGSIFTIIDVPHASSTEIHGINKQRYLIGIAYDQTLTQHGFQDGNGKFSVFDFPGAVWTEANRINDQGEIVGSYATSRTGPTSGYTEMGGVLTALMFPGSADTKVLGLNNPGTIVGQYTDSSE